MVQFSGLIDLNQGSDKYKPEVEEFKKRQEGIEQERKAPIRPVQELEQESDPQPETGQESVTEAPESE